MMVRKSSCAQVMPAYRGTVGVVRFLAVAGLVGMVLMLPPGRLWAGDAPGQKAPGAASKSEAGEEDDYELIRLLIDTLDQVERNYVRQVSRRQLVEAAIRGILSELDPYSGYISPEDMRTFRTMMEGQFGGIGIQIGIQRGRLTVLSPLVGTPAYRAGILAGDWIVKIEGQPTEGMSLDEVVKRLQGPPGTQVTITVVHPGESRQRKLSLTREIVRLETVTGAHRREDDSWEFFLDPERRIGYVRIAAFTRTTADELRRALEELTAHKMRGLILDLRFCPGGLLGAAVAVSDLFISKGRIVSTGGRNVRPQHWDAHPEGTYEGFPMVVLVNRFTASGAEIVAACLQDHKRAVVMGERTFGKGSVQNVIQLEAEEGNSQPLSALKLTTASYQRPSGHKIHRFPDDTEEDEWGVTPDNGYVRQLNRREMFIVAQQYQLRERLHRQAGGEDKEEAEEGEENGEAQPIGLRPPFVDPHLKMAVDYLRSRLDEGSKPAAKGPPPDEKPGQRGKKGAKGPAVPNEAGSPK